MSGSSYGHEDSELPEVPTEVPFDDEVDCASEAYRHLLDQRRLPGRPSDLIDYLLARRDEPCGRSVPDAIMKAISWVEKVAEFSLELRATNGRFVWAGEALRAVWVVRAGNGDRGGNVGGVDTGGQGGVGNGTVGGNGCFWHTQYDAFLVEQDAAGPFRGRNMSQITSLVGFAGGRYQSAGGAVCYGGLPATDYSRLGHAEAVSIMLDEITGPVARSQVSALAQMYFEHGFQSLPDGRRQRLDPQDVGASYRNVIGLPGGMDNSELWPLFEEANTYGMPLLRGAVGDSEGEYVVYVYDSMQYPFFRGEAHHQFHPNNVIQRPVPLSYTSTLKSVQEEMGRLEESDRTAAARSRVSIAVSRWAKNKSWGPDGISHEAVQAMLQHPQWESIILSELNDMLYKGVELLAILRRVVRMAKDWGVATWIVKLDIQKAFDSVSQVSMAQLIARKVGGMSEDPGDNGRPHAGLPWEARLWTSLLQARSLHIATGDHITHVEQTNGVRQGSPDSPVVFGALTAEALDRAVSQTAHMLGEARGPPPPEQGGAYMDDTRGKVDAQRTGPEAAKERTSAEELGDRSSEAKSRTEGELGEKQEERAADADTGDAAPTDKIKLLDADTRERLADSLFNQAYSTVMSVGTFSPREHVENTLDALIGDPLKEEIDWDSREDENIVTPPLLEEGEEARGDDTWKDLDNEVGKQAPKTPELLLSEDEGGIEADMRQQWPSQEAMATIFRNTTQEELRKEWGLDTPSSDQPGTPQEETNEQQAGERSSTTPPLEQDEIVRQVMQDLREHGGNAHQADTELEDIQVETAGEAPTTVLSAKVAGVRLGMRLRQRAEEERKRTLQVGGNGG
ncbi:hypothetical protein AK812_SmicGene38501 [Symbiodinium microadriaticum]|uniref:Reverse transcriptase domain-containing protein n=1 Tax=Symbiodinium microadriaticum TaxID=2951 RepID=A0A1Q9CDL2_SYMMI|nr:hypothetical protein AK812_SmicGene38501 [Symbiodinium microadriaticum]